ncbi:MAG: nucleotide exchange factor GrpE [Alphaproteobacteria bacterium]|nr:nucleotide exchange factor GrpE [Alphaproteobacteria bacterium]
MTSPESPPESQPAAPADDSASVTLGAAAEEIFARALAAEARASEFEAEVSRLKDQALRALAEAENTRRRAQREIEDRERFALTGFARELTSVVDNLRRALDMVSAEARAADPKFDQFAQGVELTEREFMAILDRHGIKRVVPNGQPFDHNLHQAIAQVESTTAAPGTVIQVVQAGYTLNGRILRPAMVIVAKGSAAGSAPSVDVTA